MISLYLITNIANGKRYVGKTCRTLERRWREHIKNAETDKPYHLSCAIRKYGSYSFNVKSLDSAADGDVADYLEMFWISAYQTNNPRKGYNLTAGGDGMNNPSEEVRRKMSEAKLGYKHTDEWKAALSERMKGNQFAKGVIFSEERRKKQSETMLSSDIFKQAHINRRGKPVWSDEDKRERSKQFSGVLNPFYGRKHTEASKEKMRLAKAERKAHL